MCVVCLSDMMQVFEYSCMSVYLEAMFSITVSYHNLPSQWLSIFPAVQSDDGEKQQVNQSVFHLQEKEREKKSTKH